MEQMELAPIRQEEMEVPEVGDLPETRQLPKPVRTFISPCLQVTLDTWLFVSPQNLWPLNPRAQRPLTSMLPVDG